ncbi:MAG TPA: sensor histidine kinase [Solirubrobacteraceae bacterium]|nr:sensor histidine kinase [Solirubrobacteraceae bacterium]
MHAIAPRTRAVAPAIALAAFFLVVTPHAVDGDEGVRALDALAYALLAGAGLSFALRGPHPYASCAIALACTVAYLLAGYGDGPIYVAAFLGLVRVVEVAERRVWIPVAAVGALGIAVAHVVRDGWSASASIAVSTVVWLVAAVLGGEALRARRGQAAALVARAEEEQRTHEEEARRVAAEERLRLAREVHDVVGHSLAVISLQAGVAAHLLQTRPEQARDAVAAIRQVAGEALDDLRAELALLRDPDTAPPPPAAGAGLEALPGLVASLRQAGVEVELEAPGDGDGPVPQAVSAAAYRIVREALTNVARHAGSGSRAHVRVAHAGARVEVEVLDDGAGAPLPPEAGDATLADGSGIAGMRERAAALGGHLETGPGPDGGFRVWASLPTGRP